MCSQIKPKIGKLEKTGILKLYGFFEFSDVWFNLR